MRTGNPALQAELTRLTNLSPDAGTEELDAQPRLIDELRGRFPHTIRLHTACSPAIDELNCFMYALAIEIDNNIRYMSRGRIFPGTQFVSWLLDAGHLRDVFPSNSFSCGNVVIYFRDNIPKHAGIVEAANIVVSKWGSGGTHVWRHALWEVPDTYGDEARFFATLPDAAELYLEWAAAHDV